MRWAEEEGHGEGRRNGSDELARSPLALGGAV